MEDSSYRLRYTAKDYNVALDFSDEITISELKENLRCFLLACSRHPKQVKYILGKEE